MVARYALLCLVEGALVVLLAMQVFAGGPQAIPAAPRGAGAGAPTAVPAAADAPAIAAPTVPAAEPPPQRIEAAAKWNADDPVGVLLTGTLRLADGSPVDASLSLVQGKLRRQASVSEDGSYAVLGVQPGEWEAQLRGSAIVETKVPLALSDDAVQRHDFVLDASFPMRVTIVTPDGQDATRALRTTLSDWGDFAVAGQLEAFPGHLAPTDHGVQLVGDARWEPQMNPVDGFAGTLYLGALPAHVALLQRSLVLEQQVVQPGQKEVKFTVDVAALKQYAASATLRVLDENGAPLPKASASLSTSNRMGGRPPVFDAEGRTVLEGLSPGLLRLTINAPDREGVWTTVRVDAGKRIDLGDFRLGPSLPLAGTLLDADGKPGTGNLGWTELKWHHTGVAFSHGRSTQIQADGSFQLWGTGRGKIAVTARSRDGQVAAGVFDNPPPAPVVLRLGKGGDCTVTRPADPTRAFTVTFFDAQRQPIAASTLEPRTLRLAIGLPAGSYPFEVHDDAGRLLQSGSLTFGDTPCALEIR